MMRVAERASVIEQPHARHRDPEYVLPEDEFSRHLHDADADDDEDGHAADYEDDDPGLIHCRK
ncbi:MAG: hypothetical protein LQ343_006910 [Gyalolechia ehrenbergii]|nr:MAG: hypothetical protein LQ343_006910 [Gyalolechia ehrenbergii]